MQNKTAIALGTFDGVHIGHRAVLNLPCGYKKVAVTFTVPPKAMLSDNSGLITTLEDKCRILESIGIDEICLLEFSEVRDMEALEFLEFLNKKYKPSFISCGFNYRFGKNGKGSTKTLKKYCEENQIEFRNADCVYENDIPVSSTVIREMLKNGNFSAANSLLTVPFSFETEVISGDKRGRTMGFPTVNQKYPEVLVKIKFGVYKTLVEFEEKRYQGITNIGVRPTYKSDFIISETNIIGFSGDLYGKKVRITPLEFIREERKFSGLEDLREQIDKDLNFIKEK